MTYKDLVKKTAKYADTFNSRWGGLEVAKFLKEVLNREGAFPEICTLFALDFKGDLVPFKYMQKDGQGNNIVTTKKSHSFCVLNDTYVMDVTSPSSVVLMENLLYTLKMQNRGNPRVFEFIFALGTEQYITESAVSDSFHSGTLAKKVNEVKYYNPCKGVYRKYA